LEPLKKDGRYVFPEPTHRPLPPDVRRLPSRLRQKLEADNEPRLLQTVRGYGYALREE